MQAWSCCYYPDSDIKLDLDVGMRVLERKDPDLLGVYYMASKLELPGLTYERLTRVCGEEANVKLGLFPMANFMIVRLPPTAFPTYKPRVGCCFERLE